MKIGKNWELNSDAHSWILKEFGTIRVKANKEYTGEKKWGEIKRTYHGNLSCVLHHIVDQDAKKADSLEGVLAAIRSSVNVINDAICSAQLDEMAKNATQRLKGEIA